LKWTLLPGLLAGLAFAFLVPAEKNADNRRAPKFMASLSELPPQFRRFLVAVSAHGIGDFAPTLLILRASQILTPRYGSTRAAAFSLGLYTFHNLINALAAYGAGALGDRISKRGVLAVGYLTATLAYGGFILAPPTIHVLIVLFGLAGIHVGVQQSVEKSLAAELMPAEVRGSGFGVLATANGIGDLVSSAIVGFLWTNVTPASGFAYAGVFTLLGALLILRRR
jgi:MFS family permease